MRGRGLLVGLCLYKDQTKFINKLLENKLLTVKAAENVVRLLPPLNVKKNEIKLSLKIIEKVCKKYNMKNFIDISDCSSKELREILKRQKEKITKSWVK